MEARGELDQYRHRPIGGGKVVIHERNRSHRVVADATQWKPMIRCSRLFKTDLRLVAARLQKSGDKVPAPASPEPARVDHVGTA
jgi:hypothetical protein